MTIVIKMFQVEPRHAVPLIIVLSFVAFLSPRNETFHLPCNGTSLSTQASSNPAEPFAIEENDIIRHHAILSCPLLASCATLWWVP